ncbi:hypothetical protein KY285_000049 [Solanum tuberosum]|nr:hypothetical protein KY285_000049 [Solanum tuberosum]
MNVRPSGFNNAPVTRALVIACTIFTIIFGVRGRGNQLGWSYQVFAEEMAKEEDEGEEMSKKDGGRRGPPIVGPTVKSLTSF